MSPRADSVAAPGACRSSGIGLDADPVVHRDSELLLASEVALRHLDRHVAEQELNLIEFPAGKMAETGARTPRPPSPRPESVQCAHVRPCQRDRQSPSAPLVAGSIQGVGPATLRAAGRTPSTSRPSRDPATGAWSTAPRSRGVVGPAQASASCRGARRSGALPSATNPGGQFRTQEAGVGRLVRDAPNGREPEVDRGRRVSPCSR
jgi:hypothetical protein